MEPTQTTNSKSNSTMMLSIVIVVIIIVAGIFLLRNTSMKNQIKDENPDTTYTEESIPANNLSSSDETSDIEADLNSNADIDTIDSDFK